MLKKFLLFVSKVVKAVPDTDSVELPPLSVAVALTVIVVPEITVSVVAPMFSVPAVTVKARPARPHVIFEVSVTAPVVSIITGLARIDAEPPQFPVPVNLIVDVPVTPPIVWLLVRLPLILKLNKPLMSNVEPDAAVPNVTLLKLDADDNVNVELYAIDKLFQAIFCKSRVTALPKGMLNVDPVVVKVPTFVYFRIFVFPKITFVPITIVPPGEFNSRSIPIAPVEEFDQVPDPVIISLAVPDSNAEFPCVKFLVMVTINPTPFIT